MSGPIVPRIRRGPIPAAAVLVVRGGVLAGDALRRDGIRFHRRFPDWGRYGVSAYLAADQAEVDALCDARLSAFPTIVVFHRGELEAMGVELVATFRAPHVTLAEADLDRLVETLLSCAHVERHNPYHVAEDHG